MFEELTREEMYIILRDGKAAFMCSDMQQSERTITNLKDYSIEVNVTTAKEVQELGGFNYVFVDKKIWKHTNFNGNIIVYPIKLAFHLAVVKDTCVWNGEYVEQFICDNERFILIAERDTQYLITDLAEKVHLCNGIVVKNMDENPTIAIVLSGHLTDNQKVRDLLPKVLEDNLVIVSSQQFSQNPQIIRQIKHRKKPLACFMLFTGANTKLAERIQKLGGTPVDSMTRGTIFFLQDDSLEVHINNAKSQKLYIIDSTWLARVENGNFDDLPEIRYPKPGPEIDKTFKNYGIKIRMRESFDELKMLQMKITEDEGTIIPNDSDITPDREYVVSSSTSYKYYQRSIHCLLDIIGNRHGLKCDHRHYPLICDMSLIVPSVSTAFILLQDETNSSWLVDQLAASGITCANFHDVNADFVQPTDTLFWDGKAGLEKMAPLYHVHRYLRVISMDKLCMRDTTKQTFLDTVKFDTWRQVLRDAMDKKSMLVTQKETIRFIQNKFVQLLDAHVLRHRMPWEYDTYLPDEEEERRTNEGPTVIFTAEPRYVWEQEDGPKWISAIAYAVLLLLEDVCKLKPICLFRINGFDLSVTFLCLDVYQRETPVAFISKSSCDVTTYKLCIYSYVANLVREKPFLPTTLITPSSVYVCGSSETCKCQDLIDTPGFNITHTLPIDSLEDDAVTYTHDRQGYITARRPGQDPKSYLLTEISVLNLHSTLIKEHNEFIFALSKYPLKKCEFHIRGNFTELYMPAISCNFKRRQNLNNKCDEDDCDNLAVFHPTEPQQLAITDGTEENNMEVACLV